MMDRFALRALRWCIVPAALLSASACDAIVELSGGYVGPPPAQDAIVSEVAIVAEVRTTPGGQIVLVLDRVRFVEAGNPHDVNRVVRAWTTPENVEQVRALNLQRSDRVIISTGYNGIEEGGGSMNVSDWPGHDAMEYPVGSHRIISIQRASP